MTTPGKPSRPPIRVLLLLLAGTLTLALVAGEGLARLVHEPVPYRRVPQVRYRAHPVRSFTLEPCQQDVFTLAAQAEVDCEGFRRNGIEVADDEGAVRVFALGDSFTFGMGVGDGETWPARVEALLGEQLSRPVSVVNAGTISYGVFQEMDLLREQLPVQRPDVVIHGLYWNDYQSAHPPRPDAPPVLTDDGYFVWEPDLSNQSLLTRARHAVLGRSALWNLAQGTMRAVRGGEGATSKYARTYASLLDGSLPAEDLQPLHDFYIEMQALQKQHGFELFVIVLPVVDLLDQDTSGHVYRSYVTGLLDSLEIPYLDSFALWEQQKLGREMFLPQGPDAHLNAQGYEPIAEEVASRLAARVPELPGVLARSLPVERR